MNRALSVFQTLIDVRDRNRKCHQGSCESKNGTQRKYYAENSNKVYKMKKAYYKKMRDVRNRDMLIWLTYNRYLKKQQNPPSIVE